MPKQINNNNMPSYISIADCEALISGITLIEDDNPNALSTVTVNQIIAMAEGRVVADLSPFFADPIVTTTGLPWTNLSNSSYQLLYSLFVSLSNRLIIGAFVRNNIQQAPTMGYFMDFYNNQYKEVLARIFEKLPNGYYKFPLWDIMKNPNGYIPRVPQAVYARCGSFGNFNRDGNGLRYVLQQMNNPQLTWDSNLGCWV
jgi:hypothetical protein